MADAKQLDVGSGKINMDKVALQTRQEYEQHVIDANENGEKPLDFPTWVNRQLIAKNKADQQTGYSSAN